MNDSPRSDEAVHDEPNTPRWRLREGHNTKVSPLPNLGMKISLRATRRAESIHDDAFKNEMTPIGATTIDLVGIEMVFTPRKPLLPLRRNPTRYHPLHHCHRSLHTGYHAARMTMATNQHPSCEFLPQAQRFPAPRPLPRHP